MTCRILTFSITCVGLSILSGCVAGTGLFGDKVKFSDATNPATEVICLWEPGEGKMPDGTPSRGFNGTLLFFDQQRTIPVGVHGDVTFYVHDNFGPRETWNEPIAEFTFSAEEWDRFLSESTFGASYRIFIPYTRQNLYRVNTSISVKFEPQETGGQFYSQTSQVVLPGPIRDGADPQLEHNAVVRDRSPENLKQYIADTFNPETNSPMGQPRFETIHSWDPVKTAQYSEQQETQQNSQLITHEVTRPKTSEATLPSSESELRAAAESWGSTPPALLQTSQDEPASPQTGRRFKLSTAQ